MVLSVIIRQRTYENERPRCVTVQHSHSPDAGLVSGYTSGQTTCAVHCISSGDPQAVYVCK